MACFLISFNTNGICIALYSLQSPVLAWIFKNSCNKVSISILLDQCRNWGSKSSCFFAQDYPFSNWKQGLHLRLLIPYLIVLPWFYPVPQGPPYGDTTWSLCLQQGEISLCSQGYLNQFLLPNSSHRLLGEITAWITHMHAQTHKTTTSPSVWSF